MAKRVKHPLEKTVANLLTESATICNALMQVVPKIEAIMKVCNEKGAEDMGMDLIVELCLDADLAVKKPIHARNCGIHPSHRTGFVLFNAHDVAWKISWEGYSETKLENPTCFEKAASAQLKEKQEEFNKKNFEMCKGCLKEIPHHDIEYLSITCSHTFAACNLVGGGCAWDLRAVMRQQYDDRPADSVESMPIMGKSNGGRDPMHCLPPRVGRSMP